MATTKSIYFQYLSRDSPTETPIRDWISQGIIAVTCGAAGLLPLLPRQLTNGAINQAVIVCLIIAFWCAFSAMSLLFTKPKAVIVFKISAAISMVSAVALLFTAVLRSHFC